MPNAVPFPRPAAGLEHRRIINDTAIRSIKPPAAGTSTISTTSHPDCRYASPRMTPARAPSSFGGEGHHERLRSLQL